MYIPKKISEKKVFSNGYLKLLEKIYKEKNGKESNILVLGDDKKDSIGIFILPITKKGEILYINEYRHGPDKVVCGFPAGSKDDGTSFEETAEKELFEETGYTAEKIIKLGETIIEHYVEGKAVYYLAIGCEKNGNQELEVGENIEINTTTIQNFEKMILKGKIEVAKAIAMYYIAKAKTNNFTNFDF